MILINRFVKNPSVTYGYLIVSDVGFDKMIASVMEDAKYNKPKIKKTYFDSLYPM
jgi:hypothetical protein